MLGASVMRVFRPGTRDDLLPVLSDLPVAELGQMPSQQAYRAWFERALDLVTTTLSAKNGSNPRVQPGLRWGHGAKVLCLTVASVVVGSRYFVDTDVERIQPWLYCPIDSRIIQRLVDLGCSPPFRRIREIDTAEKFYDTQELLGTAACAAGVPRILFDDNWASGPTGPHT